VKRLGVVGATGKMGRSVLRLAPDYDLDVVAAISAEGFGWDAGALAGGDASGVLVSNDLSDLAAAKADVIIDFSSVPAFPSVCGAASAAGIPLVCGTTGLGDAEQEVLARTAESVAVLWEPNMSLGIHVLSQLVEFASLWLGSSFDAEITEAHHRFKVDAPSGTALRLLETLKRARGAATVAHGRSGHTGTRGIHEIGMHAIRGGDVIGDHTVMFLGEGERIELTHRATNRDLFARGALRAAAWLAGKGKGRYRLGDMLAAAAEEDTNTPPQSI
jgi:4-hydroxy-tetrahydrodipicolinate reductase